MSSASTVKTMLETLQDNVERVVDTINDQLGGLPENLCYEAGAVARGSLYALYSEAPEQGDQMFITTSQVNGGRVVTHCYHSAARQNPLDRHAYPTEFMTLVYSKDDSRHVPYPTIAKDGLSCLCQYVTQFPPVLQDFLQCVIGAINALLDNGYTLSSALVSDDKQLRLCFRKVRGCYKLAYLTYDYNVIIHDEQSKL